MPPPWPTTLTSRLRNLQLTAGPDVSRETLRQVTMRDIQDVARAMGASPELAARTESGAEEGTGYRLGYVRAPGLTSLLVLDGSGGIQAARDGMTFRVRWPS